VALKKTEANRLPFFLALAITGMDLLDLLDLLDLALIEGNRLLFGVAHTNEVM